MEALPGRRVPGPGLAGRAARRRWATRDGEVDPAADGVVLAVPPEVAAWLGCACGGGTAAAGGPAPATGRSPRPRLVPGPPRAGPRASSSGCSSATSPIVNVHVVYDRRVTRLPFAAAVDSPVQWVFDRTGPSGLRTGQYLAVSLSAADAYADVPAAAAARAVPARAGRAVPGGGAGAGQSISSSPGSGGPRCARCPGAGGCGPEPPPPLPGLVLAGAWTDTGWPDTMEGAVRSGLNAVRELRRSMGVAALRPGTGPGASGRSPVSERRRAGAQA